MNCPTQTVVLSVLQQCREQWSRRGRRILRVGRRTRHFGETVGRGMKTPFAVDLLQRKCRAREMWQSPPFAAFLPSGRDIESELVPRNRHRSFGVCRSEIHADENWTGLQRPFTRSRDLVGRGISVITRPACHPDKRELIVSHHAARRGERVLQKAAYVHRGPWGQAPLRNVSL
jgi:hypothetical protein